MAKRRRTTHRSSKGTKLYAVRDKSGKFKDIQTFKRAHAADLRHVSANELAHRIERKEKQNEASSKPKATSVVHKVVIANLSRLKKKYGSKYKALTAAMKSWLSSDKALGLKSAVIDISSSKVMSKFGGIAVADPVQGEQTKNAIDAVYRHYTPDYIVILGGPDVVCHQSLINPVRDEDADVPSDLPYACEAGYSRRIRDFLAPTRVVGRLPDLVNATDPKYLIGLIESATRYQPRPRSDYEAYFGLSAKVWKKSTALSLQKMFGNADSLKTSPDDGPNWTSNDLAKLSHFINCHGSPADHRFLGEPANYPIAHDSTKLAGKISKGSIVAAECCYGAELYDPTLSGGALGICCEYLRSGAYGFFGSTTIAYGPADGNGAADIITQDFIRHALSGASLGRAALQARQDYVLKNSVMTKIDLKTLAQFYLLGDPSIHAVARTSDASNIPKSKSAPARSAIRKSSANAVDRRVRREALFKNGLAIGMASNYADGDSILDVDAKSSVVQELHQALGKDIDYLGYEKLEVVSPQATLFAKTAAKVPSLLAATRIHVCMGKRATKGLKVPQFVVAILRESDGEEGKIATYYSR